MPKEQSPGKPTTRRYTPQEKAELKRANEVLKRAASSFGAELDRQHKR